MAQGASKLIFFDLETAGLDPLRHPIIQLAAVAVDEELKPLEAFEAKLHFDPRRAEKHSLRKNHYRPGIWAREAIEPREAAFSFAEFLRRHASVPTLSASGEEYLLAQLVAHNATFDAPFLQTWYERQRVFLPARRLVLCTLQRSLWLVSERPELTAPRDHKLSTLCQHFGVPFHAASAHEALGDVAATVELYRALRARSRSPGTSVHQRDQANRRGDLELDLADRAQRQEKVGALSFERAP